MENINQSVVSVFDNKNTSVLAKEIQEYSDKKNLKIESDFNDSFAYMVTLENNESVAIDNKQITSDTKLVKKISVSIDSETAKKEILNKYGIDLNAIMNKVNSSEFAKQKLNTLFKKVAKSL